MGRYFDDDGNALKLDALFDSDLESNLDALTEAARFATDESDAVRMYWANDMANQTHGNYSAGGLFDRSRPEDAPKHSRPKPSTATIPAFVWVEFEGAAVNRRLARWVKAVWVEQPPDHRAAACLRVAVVDSEANRKEAERQAIITRALAKLTAEERAALGHSKP